MPGTRHAKNNTALGYFTRHERAKLGWGSQRKRLSKDSIKQFYACTICLKLCELPVLCPGGDLFCKECIYQSLLAQKRKHKQQMADYNQQQLDEQHKAQTENRKNVVDKFLQFDRLQTPTSSPLGQDQAHLSSLNKTTFTNTPSSNVLDASSTTTATPSTTSSVVQSSDPKKGKLSCFWIPSVACDHRPFSLSLSLHILAPSGCDVVRCASTSEFQSGFPRIPSLQNVCFTVNMSADPRCRTQSTQSTRYEDVLSGM